MSDYFAKKALGTRDANRSSHANSDVDEARDSLHHTLGASGNQAAPGNHSHYFAGTTEGGIDTNATFVPSGVLTNDDVEYLVYTFSDLTPAVSGISKASVATITVFFNARATTNSACWWYLKCNGIVIDAHRNHNNFDQYMNMGATLTGSVDIRKLDSFSVTVHGKNDALGSPITCGPAHVSVSFT